MALTSAAEYNESQREMAAIIFKNTVKNSRGPNDQMLWFMI